MKKIISILSFIAFAFSSIAQDSSKTFHFSVGLGFMPVPTISITGIDTSYNNSLSIAPLLDIRNNNGLGISYSPKFVAGGPSAGIYAHQVIVGLESYNKELFDVVADYSHYFFTGNIGIPSSPITNELYFSSTYKKPWVMPTLTLGYGFGTLKTAQSSKAVNDVNVSAGVSHVFQKEISDATFSLVPELKLNAGTNEYFSLLRSSRYISANKNYNKVVKRKKRNGTVIVANTQVAKKSFSLSNAEAELQGSFEKGSFSVRPGVSMFVPFSSGDNAVSLIWQIEMRYSF